MVLHLSREISVCYVATWWLGGCGGLVAAPRPGVIAAVLWVAYQDPILCSPTSENILEDPQDGTNIFTPDWRHVLIPSSFDFP